ncbi:MAG: ABC transporter permease [Bacteroidota bacterium]
MLKNYLFVAFRSLRRRKGYAGLNVFGLAVGLACFFLLGLYVRDELAFDRFHADVEQIYAVGTVSERSGETYYSMVHAPPVTGLMAEHVPEVAATVREYAARVQVRVADDRFDDQRRRYVEPGFFEVFDFPRVAGDLTTALDAPNQAVLSEQAAQRYFGQADPIGQTVSIDVTPDLFGGTSEPRDLTVVAVVEVPRTSSITFDLLVSVATPGGVLTDPDIWTIHLSGGAFVRLQPGVTQAQLSAALDRFATDVYNERANRTVNFHAIPLTDFYFSDFYRSDGLRGDARYLALFGGIALLVLLIAVVNYTNLATAQAADRTREVGVRKAIGAGRRQLAGQFLGEALLVSAAAFVLAVVLVTAALPGFNALFGTDLGTGLLLSGATLPLMLALALGTGLLAGAYPAFVLARQRPMEVLRAGGAPQGGSAGLRKVLVVAQFAVTVALLVGVAGIVKQLRYVQTADLGFDGERVLHVELDDLAEQSEAAKAAFLQHPAVRVASATGAAPGNYWGMYSAGDLEGQPTSEDGASFTSLWVVFADADYADVLGLDLAAGRFLDPDIATDATNAVVLNEAAAHALGWAEGDAAVPAALGKTMNWVAEGSQIVGVVEDFHFGSMHDVIEPAGIRFGDPSPDNPRPDHTGLLLKLDTRDLLVTMSELEATWRSLAPDAPFETTFVDEYYEQMYRSEVRLGRILGVFAGLAIFVACLGLVGLAAFTAQRRTKEIGVRKVLGASVASILRLLTRDFALLVAVAFVVAAPVAWWGLQRWLESFAYRAEVGVGTVLLAGLAALAVALLATGALAWRAARMDPVRALRYE